MKICRLLLLLLLLFPSSDSEGQNSSSSAAIFIPKPGPVSWKFIAYAVEGFIATTGNLLIIFAIMINKELRRKELIIILGMAIAEFNSGFAFFTAGIRRSWLEATGYIQQPTTPWHCMLVIHNLFFALGAPFRPFMMILMSVDRLLAVKTPLWYWKQRNKYAYTCLAVIFAISVPFLALKMVAAYFKPTNSAIVLACNGAMSYPVWISTMNQGCTALGGWGSVLIYVLVVYFYREHGKTLPNEQLIQEHLERQRKMTKSIGICVLITFFTVCIGRTAKTILSSFRGILIDHKTFYTISPMFDVFINVNKMENVFVYCYWQREIRAAIVRILTCGRVKLNVDGPAKVHSLKQQRNARVAPQNAWSNEA